MHGDAELLSALDSLIDEGCITEVISQVKSGKEATVFCCRGGPATGEPLIAAKVHRPLETRRFRNDAMYQGGRVVMAHDSRYRRALLNKSAFGRKVQYGTWLHQEWETLRVLRGGGVRVPRPIAIGERALLMSFVGDESAAAPALHEADPTPAETASIIDELLGEIEVMLDLHVVHGDLSAYNILLDDSGPVIIDFSQATAPRLNAGAASLLQRDLENVCRWAAKHGADRPADRIFISLWTRFVEGRIG